VTKDAHRAIGFLNQKSIHGPDTGRNFAINRGNAPPALTSARL
jgi:hypothetical protein